MFLSEIIFCKIILLRSNNKYHTLFLQQSVIYSKYMCQKGLTETTERIIFT
jgi:hypothetical protein